MLQDGTLMGELVNTLKAFGHTLHFPVMFGAFAIGVFLRTVIFYTVNRHAWFGREFERRVTHFLEKEMDHKTSNVSFYVVTKSLLERTFYEIFEKREKERLSRKDELVLKSDRLFLIKAGCAWLVHDLLRQVRFLRYGDQPPKLVNIAKNNFSKNPAFNRVFGLLPLVATNDLLSILPGLFVVGGIFGTFLSVMGAIPNLSGMMSASDPAQSQNIMDTFLTGVASSMAASVIGIFLSVMTSLYNTAVNPERLYVDIVDRFENSLDLLWNYAHSNEVPSGLKPFDENRDPVEALAEAAMNQELDKHKLRSEFDDLKPKQKAS